MALDLPDQCAGLRFGLRPRLVVFPHRTGEDANPRLDLGGVGLLTPSSALLVIPPIEGRQFGWTLRAHRCLRYWRTVSASKHSRSAIRASDQPSA